MSHIKPNDRITVTTLRAMKSRGEKISMLTAYDYTMSMILDSAGVDVLLVGDSAANVFGGHDTTLPITLEAMIYHASAVRRGSSRSLVLVDMPFGTYQGSAEEAYRSAVRIIKESNAQALKMEGGIEIIDNIKKVVQAGIPVCGHLGLTPQSIHKFGNFGVRAKESAESMKLKSDAISLQEAGCFALVLEKIPASLATEVTQSLSIPVIGIGAGADCDGQVLVVNDMLGLTKDFKPKFIRQYLQLHEDIKHAASQYVQDVKSVSFPNISEQY